MPDYLILAVERVRSLALRASGIGFHQKMTGIVLEPIITAFMQRIIIVFRGNLGGFLAWQICSKFSKIAEISGEFAILKLQNSKISKSKRQKICAKNIYGVFAILIFGAILAECSSKITHL